MDEQVNQKLIAILAHLDKEFPEDGDLSKQSRGWPLYMCCIVRDEVVTPYSELKAEMQADGGVG